MVPGQSHVAAFVGVLCFRERFNQIILALSNVYKRARCSLTPMAAGVSVTTRAARAGLPQTMRTAGARDVPFIGIDKMQGCGSIKEHKDARMRINKGA